MLPPAWRKRARSHSTSASPSTCGALRAARGLSLEAMAARCDVSRSMISLIERGESSPTAVVLEKIATGLNVPLASLFDAPRAATSPVARRDEQPLWRDPQSGYVRRNVSPGGSSSPIQIVEVSFPAGRARRLRDRRPRAAHPPAGVGARGRDRRRRSAIDDHRLEEGDCLAMLLDRPTSFHNHTRRDARYAVVIVPEHARGG